VNADANQDPWSQRLSLTTLAPELSLLALRSLGIPLDILGSIFNFDRLQLLATSQAGLRLGRNLKVRPSDEHGFDISPFGLDELAQLQAQDIPDTVHQKFDFQWARGPLVDVARQEDVPGGPHHILRPDPGFDVFLEDVCGFFLGPRCLKLLLLLPRPQGASDAFGWDVLRVGEPPRDWHPVRLLGTLAMLGLTHNTAGHRTQVLPEIIDRWQALSDQVAVVGRRCSTTRHDPIWCSQMKGLAAGTILLPPMKRPSSLGKPQACPSSLTSAIFGRSSLTAIPTGQFRRMKKMLTNWPMPWAGSCPAVLAYVSSCRCRRRPRPRKLMTSA